MPLWLSIANLVSADIRCNSVDAAGTICIYLNHNPGAGYTGSSQLMIKFSAPKIVGVGIGTTATATANVSAANGTITSVTITNIGLGYTTTVSPNVIIAEIPTASYESYFRSSKCSRIQWNYYWNLVKLQDLVVKRQLSSTSLDSKIMVEMVNLKLLQMS